MGPGRKSISPALSSCLGPSILPCPGQAAEKVSESASAGNRFPARDILRFREERRDKGMGRIRMEKFRPFLCRNHCLRMIREPPLRLGPDRTGEDKYIKMGGFKVHAFLKRGLFSDRIF
jgi:hypothetical protein